MFDEPPEPPETRPARSSDLLLAVAIVAIIAMPFVAGRHPSGAQTVLVLAACAALAAIALAVLAYGGRRQVVASRRSRATTGELPRPDDLTVYRQRAHR